MKKIAIAVLATMFPLFANAQPAATTSSTISLGGGVAAPTKTLKISTKKLVENIGYNITCNVIAPQSTSDEPTIAHIYLDSSMMGDRISEIRINGTIVGYNNVQVGLPLSSELVISNVVSWNDADSLAIQNADQQNEIRVDNCVAVAMS